MISYDAALERTDPATRAVIADAIFAMEASGITLVRRLAQNVKIETRLGPEIWAQIFHMLQGVSPTRDAEVDASAYASVLRDCFSSLLLPAPTPCGSRSRFPVGPAINEIAMYTFGRLIPYDRLLQLWSASSRLPGFGGPRRSVSILKSEIDSLRDPDVLAVAKGSGPLTQSPLGEYVMWSTFDEAGGRDPFASRPDSLKALVAALGVDARQLLGLESVEWPKRPSRRSMCVLLRYELPETIKPCVPTIVEAYAGNSTINYYFSVCPYDVDVPRRLFPRTLATPAGAYERGVPEAVHSVVFGSHLTQPLELVVC